MEPVATLRFPLEELPEAAVALRGEVRAFLAGELAAGSFVPRCDAWLSGADPAFSRRLGVRGWLGMTWPKKYGGHERSALERHIVIEELLAAGAPVAAHWIADRQTGPLLLRYGTEEQRLRYLPGMARGDVQFAIGMSEPDAGSDLASVRTAGRKVEGGWRLDGTKVWTSGAHLADAMITLARTEPIGDDRHLGLSQVIVDLKGPGVEIRPIRLLTGEHHFNEVLLRDCFVPDGMVVGKLGEGWKQVTSELAYERSGPERFLSTFPLLAAMAAASGSASVGRLAAELWALRRLSLAVAAALQRGEEPVIEAALVKDLGTRFEREVTELSRTIHGGEPNHPLYEHYRRSLLEGPGFTLRGGTNEVLRSVVARSLK
ncbi:MAG: acyl-CoA dehydrogenase family protein [Candidatus Dormibacteraeota bacterium]|nr:acyl-CoA dehydrogenase family protein [Candidatus Dormibacteraeota bacterium]